MTNFEKYKDEILKIAKETEAFPTIKNSAPVRCVDADGCGDCEIKEGDCCTNFIEWLYKDDGEQEQKITCDSCKHMDRDKREYPCLKCRLNYINLFEPKPKKTRQSEFLKMFPNTMMENGVIDLQPCIVDKNQKACCNPYGYCIDCRKDYWLKEVE